MCLGLFSGTGANWHAKIPVHTAEAFQLPSKGSYTQTVLWQCLQVYACLPSCAHEWFGRLLLGAVQNDARDCSSNWDDLAQLPRIIIYNCVSYWCRCSLQLHQPITMFIQKIFQEERDLWSPHGRTTLRVTFKIRAACLGPSPHDFCNSLRVEISASPSAWQLTVNIFVLVSKQIQATSHWSASYWFFG